MTGSARNLDRPALAEMQLVKLRDMMALVLRDNAFYRNKLSSAIEPSKLRSQHQLTELPFTTKTELLADQEANPPYGSNLTYPIGRYCRLHQTSGTTRGRPLRWLDTPESWNWFLECWRVIYETIGLRPDDRLLFPFSFGPFVGFWAAFEGAVRLGNLCLAAGGMTSSARLRFLLDNQATVICCTPTYALRLAEVAQQEGIDLPSSPVRAIVVAGEPGGSIPSTRQRIEHAWAARVFDHCGMTEVGSLGIECLDNPGGLHLLETECIAEVIDPQTGAPVRPGHDGELVLTTLGRWGSPVIRYRTGDLVTIDPEPCPCGLPFVRLAGGIRGRIDDMLVIRGNNVYPSAIEEIVRRFDPVTEFQIEADRQDALVTLRIRIECQTTETATDVAQRIAETVRNELHFRPEVTVVPPGTLPRSEMKSRRLVRKIDTGLGKQP